MPKWWTRSAGERAAAYISQMPEAEEFTSLDLSMVTDVPRPGHGNGRNATAVMVDAYRFGFVTRRRQTEDEGQRHIWVYRRIPGTPEPKPS